MGGEKQKVLKEILNEIFERIRNIGHAGTPVDEMMDAVEGMGHLIKWGHDLQGMINAIDLEGVPGIFHWFEHMLLDFTSSSGIPLPFADAVRLATGMEMDEAIDWLCVNASDLLEAGGELALLKAFKNNPRMYKAAVAIGSALGIVGDNPLLLALNTVLFLKMFGWDKKLWGARDQIGLLSKCLDVFSKAAMGIAAADIGLGLMGLDLVELVTGIGDATDFSEVAEIAEAAGDFIDGAATLGLGIMLRKGSRWLLGALTQKKRERILKKQAVHTALEAIKAGLRRNVPLPNLANFVRAAKDSGFYTSQLQEGA